jgi:hypothetical protein
MAQPPPELPESVVLQQFGGIKNTVAPERLTAAELEKAINIDLDDIGYARRRRGYTQVVAGSFHSLFRHGEKVYGVKDGVLGIIRANYSFTSLTTVSHEPISYTPVGDRIYFSSLTHAGIIEASDTVSQWGTIVGTTWLSPVIAPTDTLGAISGKLLGNPPQATLIAQYSGRIYMAYERTIWVTELYNYSLVDKTKNFLQFEDNITLLMPVQDGIFVGTEGGLVFLKGVFGKMSYNQINSDPVLRGSGTYVPVELVHPQAKNGPLPTGEAAVFMAACGICAGFDGGSCYNLTYDRVMFPGATSAAALFRQQDGANTYVAVADSGGTPVAKARIGDYVDAEIVRFQGG